MFPADPFLTLQPLRTTRLSEINYLLIYLNLSKLNLSKSKRSSHNQASTDRLELAKLLNISDTQLSYITNVDAGHGLIKVGSSLVPFANKFPKHTKLYKLMTTKPGEGA